MALLGRSASVLYGNEDDSPSWPNNWSPSPYKGDNIAFILRRLREVMPHDRWFLSGSMANPEISFRHCSDIDIFFPTIEDLTTARATLNARSDCDMYNTSSCAETFNIRDIGLYVQLVSKHVGTPEEIFESFDLNVVRHLMHSDGKYVAGEGANDEIIRIVNPNASSISRVEKYIKRLRCPPSIKDKVWIQIIDEHIDNTDIVEHYYEEDGTNMLNKSFNAIMYYRLKWAKRLRPYLDKQALEHAPELLV